MDLRYVLFILCPIFCFGQPCSFKSALVSFKRPTYDFSVRILDRVAQETDFHFVFSPISTWLQLTTLAEGANGRTADEIWKITRYHRMKCFRRKFREILNLVDEGLRPVAKRSSTIVINKLLDVKKNFIDEVETSEGTKVLTLDFSDRASAAETVNELINTNMDGSGDVLDEDDFQFKVLLMTDTAYFKSDWLTPFNPLYTSREEFLSEELKEIGEVNLMTQIGYFNVSDVPLINARVLELPFATDDRVSMLIAIPIKGSVRDVYYKMKDIRLMTIFSFLKRNGPQLVTVKLPRFKINTEVVNIPELVHDMGVKRIFYPDLADFDGISDYKLHASLMTQIADIEITEKGANATVSAEFLISDKKTSEQYTANRPFAYLIVDKKTDIILFAGIYSKPSVY